MRTRAFQAPTILSRFITLVCIKQKSLTGLQFQSCSRFKLYNLEYTCEKQQ